MLLNIRVFDKELNKMLYSNVEQMDDSLLVRFEQHLEDEEPKYMLGSGRKDVNEKEVFDSDIVELTDYRGIKRTVKVWYSKTYTTFFYGQDAYSDEYLFNASNIKIIGNTHQHLHLLEQDNDLNKD